MNVLTPWGLREFYHRPSSRAMVGRRPKQEDMGAYGARLNDLSCRRTTILQLWESEVLQ